MFRVSTLSLTKIQDFSRTFQDPYEKFSRTFSDPSADLARYHPPLAM